MQRGKSYWTRWREGGKRKVSKGKEKRKSRRREGERERLDTHVKE